MSRRPIRKLEVKRMFEPGRLSQAHLEKAYERIIPKQTRVVQRSLDTSAAKVEGNETIMRRKVR